MMTEKASAEQSMDEILASIRQLISSDVQAQPFMPEPQGDDILDLTEVVSEEEPALDIQYQELKEWASNTNQQSWPEDAVKTPRGMSEAEVIESSCEEPLLSQTTVSETTQAFDFLRKNAQERPAPSSSQGQAGQPLEAMIREMLKPLLKEWLDAHLPSLVHSIVTQQVEQIVQQASRDSQNKRRFS